MAKLCLKKKSKRVPAKRRYRIEKQVRSHNRKVKREAKKKIKAGVKNKKKTVITIPKDCPFKDEIMAEVNELKKRKEEERQKQRALLKQEREERKKLEKESVDIEKLVSKAEAKQKIHEALSEPEEIPILTKREGSLRAYYKEFRKVVEAADVILEVVDARDPLGTRCKQVEQAVLESPGNKRLVIVINKADLIPRQNLDQWLKYLRGSFPTVPFKASTQMQARNLGRKRLLKSKIKGGTQAIQVSSCVGAELLMSLLGNYCRNKDVKVAIKVGVVGLPNVGKSSIINSLKRSRACLVGATPGVTKEMQEVQLDTKIKLLDSPGLVFASSKSGNDAIVALKNAAKVEMLVDPFPAALAILQRTTKNQMMAQYDIGEYSTTEEFFTLKAKRQGKFKKGGILDIEAAARGLIDDWNRGKIRYYTLPPEDRETHVSSTIVQEMSKEFDLDNLERMEVDMLTELESATNIDSSFKVDSTGIVEAEMMEDDNEGLLGTNIIVPEKIKKAQKRENTSGKDETDIPISNKKLQKLMVKKARKENSRKEKAAAKLADDLGGFSLLDKDDTDAYSFKTDYVQP